MMPSTNTSLPPDLVDMIIRHLSGDKDALRNCALVSRTWSVFSQRALFRSIQVNLDTYKKMAKLLDDLISLPHLQTLVRGLTICERRPDDGIPSCTHMSCLASVLSLLPNLMKVVFEDNDPEGSYLDLIPNVLGNAPLVELDYEVYSIETFQHVFEILGGTIIKRVSLSGSIYGQTQGQTLVSGAIRKRLHLPSLERIRFGVSGLEEEFHNCLTHYFALPNLKQFECFTESVDDLVRWRDVLLRGFPPLELFKLELGIGFPDHLDYTEIREEDAFQPIPLAGLQFQHVHLSVNPEYLDDTRRFIEWWSSTFRALSDSKATIHFTELTFTFTDLQDINTLEEAWNSLDDSLAHTRFSGVRNIHFERRIWQGELDPLQAAYYRVQQAFESLLMLISPPGGNGRGTRNTSYLTPSPVFADRMRLVLPRLASRGVLRFV
ncbi:hypothetical protein BDZ89DRAFT_698008 [Hymenopellis radicata]|nr:hypothetical protein BDZ89DRAFT_698008 [Hymenopellis radicata]